MASEMIDVGRRVELTGPVRMLDLEPWPAGSRGVIRAINETRGRVTVSVQLDATPTRDSGIVHVFVQQVRLIDA